MEDEKKIRAREAHDEYLQKMLNRSQIGSAIFLVAFCVIGMGIGVGIVKGIQWLITHFIG